MTNQTNQTGAGLLEFSETGFNQFAIKVNISKVSLENPIKANLQALVENYNDMLANCREVKRIASGDVIR